MGFFRNKKLAGMQYSGYSAAAPQLLCGNANREAKEMTTQGLAETIERARLWFCCIINTILDLNCAKFSQPCGLELVAGVGEVCAAQF